MEREPEGDERPVAALPTMLGASDAPATVYEPVTSQNTARRALWGVADQGLNSLTNIALTILVATSVGSEEFGAFAIIALTFALILGLSQTLTCEVFIVVHSTTGTENAKDPLRAAAGCSLVIGAVFSLVALAVAFLTDGPISDVLPAFALVAPVIFVQDFWRFSLFAAHRPAAGFVNDLIWAIVQAAGFVALEVLLEPGAEELVLVWGAGGLVAAIAGAAQLGVLPHPSRAWSWLNQHRHLGGRFAGEWIMLWGAVQVLSILVGVIAGLTAVARLRAAQVPFGPLQAALRGVMLSLTSLAVRVLERPERLARFMLWVTTVLVVVSTLCSVVVVKFADEFGPTFLGSSWRGADRLLIPVSIGTIAAAVQIGALLVLRATQAAKRTFRTRAILAVAVLVLGTVGTALEGAFGATLGLAIASVLGAALLVRDARAVLSALRAS